MKGGESFFRGQKNDILIWYFGGRQSYFSKCKGGMGQKADMASKNGPKDTDGHSGKSHKQHFCGIFVFCVS